MEPQERYVQASRAQLPVCQERSPCRSRVQLTADDDTRQEKFAVHDQQTGGGHRCWGRHAVNTLSMIMDRDVEESVYEGLRAGVCGSGSASISVDDSTGDVALEVEKCTPRKDEMTKQEAPFASPQCLLYEKSKTSYKMVLPNGQETIEMTKMKQEGNLCYSVYAPMR